RDEARTRAFAEQHAANGALIFTDHHAFLERAHLDLVIICLPPFAHSDEVQVAAECGIHILIEKPIALTSDAAWAMVHAAERAGIKTQVGFVYRFGAAVEVLHERLEQGEIGPVGLLSARFFANSLNASWWRDRTQSGGQLVEQTIHLFDLFRYLVVKDNEPIRVYSRQVNLFHRHLVDYTAEDVNATILECASGALGVLYATNAAVPNKWTKEWQIVTPQLLAEFSDWNHAVFTPTDTLNRVPQTISSERDPFVAQLQDLITAIRTNGETRTPLREGARSLDLVLAAVRSNESHLPIEFQPT
ncbi:MAG TPA: Gfo/Idh/MocA family oxidoreductase, partial [Anaerolineae bacterium]|nr:Gfo/Idh/MocA family oxidoreductase [Anaerolineae bacterium]